MIRHPDDALRWAVFGAVWALAGAALGLFFFLRVLP